MRSPYLRWLTSEGQEQVFVLSLDEALLDKACEGFRYGPVWSAHKLVAPVYSVRIENIELVPPAGHHESAVRRALKELKK